jgi:hypothetical protein
MELFNYLGTLKIARRLLPIFIVSSNVATKTRFRPFTVTSLHPFRFVIRSPRRALRPEIVIVFAINFSFGPRLYQRLDDCQYKTE